jgi:hypothetical protein
MKKIISLVLLSLFTQYLFAEENQENKITSTNEIVLQGSSLPEVKLGYTKYFTFPFLQGESPLTEGNNIGLGLCAEISPASLNGIAVATWTPIAFFQLMTGGRIGSGWNITLFDNTVYGIGINHSNSEGKSEHNGSAFDGLLWKAQVGTVLQADLAALFPGDWNHVVARSYHEINYRGYTRAAKNESWYFENDEGENCNGFNYYGNLLIGYQMPIFLNIAALLAEADLYLYDTPDRGQWKDDKIRWTFSAVLGFTITEQFGISLITQCITRRNYLEKNWQDLYYRNRTIDNSNPLRLEFYRVAAALTYRF